MPEAPRHAAHRAPEADHSRRAILIAAAAGVVSLAAGTVAARMNHFLGWGETEAASHTDPAETGINPSEATPGATAELVLPPEFNKDKEVNPLVGGTWKFMPGAKDAPDNGLHITGLGRTLRPQVGTDVYADASQRIPLSTINAYGTHVKTCGADFGIAGRLSNIEGGAASVNLFAAPDLVFDERIERAPRMTVTAASDALTVTVWNKGGNSAAEPKQIMLKHPGQHTDFWVKQAGSQIVVGSGDQSITFAADLFKVSGNVWFGFDGEPGTTFNVDELKAYPVGQGATPELVDTSKLKLGAPLPNGFQTIVHQKRPDVTIGTTFADFTALERYPQLGELVGSQVGAIKPEGIGKMGDIFTGSPDKDGTIRDEDLNWAEMDAFVDLAGRNGKEVHMHTLIFGEALPPKVEQFLKDVAEGKLSHEAAKNFMQQYITKFVSRYKDQVKKWDVVNEPLADTENFDKAANPYRKNAWYKAFGGTEYVRVACEAAKHAGAEVVIVNDNGMETDDDRAQAMIDLTAELRNQGYVDGIGFQAHLDSGPDSDIDSWSENGVAQESYVFDDMTTRFKQFGAYKVFISELSIDSADAHEQAVVSHGMMRAAMHAQNVKGVCWWGLATGPFYMTSENGQLGNDAPWNWDANGRPVQKEAVGAIQQGLRA
ncbi:MAG TPA: endo-1,4-beta-xylanase [Candidatus Saccharimonadales bacterium]|jgi:endo-1,4-beta-xylanase|nr:endo-1,4-beta-xylanase [Candidatus Saccharimonadales bacterium]